MSDLSQSKKGRILIVEDDWLLATELENQLRELGYEIAAKASSGEDALSSATSTMPDVVIMDIRLGGKIKGTEAALWLTERFHLPIIFLTAYADADTLSAARASHPHALIAKPHHASELNFAVQLALDSRKVTVLTRAKD